MFSEYITLVSDSSLDQFPLNIIGSFRAKLPHPVTLDRDKHVIGLSYIGWPNTLFNVDACDIAIKAITTRNEIHEIGGTCTVVPIETKQTIKKTLQAGYYSDVEDLLDVLNQLLRSSCFNNSQLAPFDMADEWAKFVYDRRAERVSLDLKVDSPCFIHVKLPVKLWCQLGFGYRFDPGTKWQWLRPVLVTEGPSPWSGEGVEYTVYAPQVVDLELGNNAVFLYADVIKPSRLVGNRITSLLAILPGFEGKHNARSHYSPRNVEYCPLAFDSFDEISIDLVNDFGEILKFQSGKVILTLHVKNKYG